MPEHLRSLIIILFLSTTVFIFARPFACNIISSGDFTRRRNLWFVITITAFLANSYWVYVLIAIPLLIYSIRREINQPALYFFILFALPAATIFVPGIGPINYFFELSQARLLALFILLPAFFVLKRQSDSLSFGRTGPDKLLAMYLLLQMITSFGGPSLTDVLRNIFYLFIDTFLPYFVMSRALKNLQDFRAALLSFVLATMVLALLAVFEGFKSWLLYSSLLISLGMPEGPMYLARDGVIRAIVTAGNSIVLGYLMVVGIGLFLFLQHSVPKKLYRWLGMGLLAAGMFAALSRGPWVGAIVLLTVFVATGRYASGRLVGLGVAAMLALSLLSVLPGGERIINLLPFIGTTDKGNVDYREQLITNSIIVVQRNPWFGTYDYFTQPEMEALRTGEGIIDIVNSYIGVVLEHGLVGLGLFVGFFVLTLLGIYRAMRSIPDIDSEERLLGRALLATLVAIMVIIFTVSSIMNIPIVYWSVAGLGVAYAQMIRKNKIDAEFSYSKREGEVQAK